MQAPSTLTAAMCWGEGPENCAPLIPYEQQSETADTWLSELPAFPTYDNLSIQVGEAAEVQFDRIVFDNPRLIDSPFYVIDQSNAAALQFENITVTGSSWSSSGPGRVLLPPAAHRPLDWWKIWLFLVGLALFFGLAALFFWQSPRVSLGMARFAYNERRVLLWLAFVGLLQLLIVQNAQVIFNGGDTYGYMTKAVALVETGLYDTGGFEHELNRTPGYPLFLAIIFKLFGYQLSNVSLLQSILYGFAVYLFARSLRNLVPDWVLIAAGSAALLCPPAIWAGTQMLSESLYLSLCLGGLAAYIEYLRRPSYRWLLLFTLIASLAFFARVNAVILFLIPILFTFKEFIECFVKRKEALRPAAVFKLSLPVIVVMGILLSLSTAWSWRNYQSRNYFGLTDYSNLTNVAGQFFSGAFDFRSLPPHNLLDGYLREKYNRHNVYYVWDLRPQIFTAITDNKTRVDARTITQLDEILGDIYRRSEAYTAWELKVVSYLRNFRWSIDVEPLYDGSKYRAYFGFNYSKQQYEYTQETITSLHKKIVHDWRQPGIINAYYPKLVDWYERVNSYFIVLALIGSLYLLRKNLILAAPFFLFVLNILLLVYLRNVSLPRYIHILFPLICFLLVISLHQVWCDFRAALIKQPQG